MTQQADPNTTRLYLIRHGQTDWNFQGRWQGHYDEPLNAQGRRESTMVAENFLRENIVFSAVFCSDLQRAKETAMDLAAAMKLPLHVLHELREIDVGYWSGMTHKEIAQRYPDELNLVETGHDVPRGGGETRTQFHKRINSAIEKITRGFAGKNILVVTHGGCIRATLTITHTDPNPGKLTIANGSISILTHHAPSHWRLEKLNDTTHLTAVNAAAASGLSQGESQMSQAPDMLAPMNDQKSQA